MLAPSGLYYSHITGNAFLKVKVKVKSGYEYKFMYSYKTNRKSDFKIGILDDNGNELQPAYQSGVEHTGLLTPKTDGVWHREGYTLFTPASGYVYFFITGQDADIYLDAVSLYKSRLSCEEDPNTYDNDITSKDDSNNQSYDNFGGTIFDDQAIFDDINDNDESKEDISSTGGRYKKIRRIYTTSWWVYALIVAGCLVAIGGISVLVIVLVKKKHRKSIK